MVIEEEQNSIIETRNELLDDKQDIRNTQREITEQRAWWMIVVVTVREWLILLKEEWANDQSAVQPVSQPASLSSSK